MNIRKITLLAASCLSAVAGVFLLNSSSQEQYFPRESTAFQTQDEIHSGYVEYMASIRNNRESGTISSAEVSAAMKQASKMRSGNKALNLTWNFKGPDNVGGRTRAIVIDNADTNHLYAGSVSGGVWESFDAGLTWSAYDNNFKIQNVAAMAQAPNGDVYVATGPYFDGSSNEKAVRSEFVGNGLWKLTGNGNSDLIVGPIAEFNYGLDWSTMAEIAIDPNNSQRIFVAMNRGLRETTDGGQTWTNPLGLVSPCQDVHISADGKIIVSFSNAVYVSTDNGLTWNTAVLPGKLSTSRIELAIAPSNSNIMYAAASGTNCTEGVYRTSDGGSTWQKLLNTPNYMGNAISCQGFYDNTIAVYPNDPGKIVVGGVSMFQWRQSSVDPAPVQGEWKVISTTNEFFGNGSRNIFYVHADKHYLLFHPTNANKLFIGSDGGIGFSDNMNDLQPTFGQYNLGYNVTQFYDIGVGPKDIVAGGTQDNGTQLVGFNFNTGKSAVEVRGGDGFDTELFTINPELGIASLYFGGITRLQGIGTTLGSSTFNNAGIYSGTLAALCNSTSSFDRCSEVFYTTVAKWESFNHTATKDSIVVREVRTTLPPLAANTVIPYASKNNRLPLQATLAVATLPADTTTIDPISSEDTLRIAIDNSLRVLTFINAFDTITVNEGSMTIEFKYRGKAAEIKPFTYGNRVNYTNIFHNDLSRVAIPRRPLSITVEQDTSRGQSEVVYIDPQVKFNYRLEFPDLVQSTVALFNVRGNLPTQFNQRHVWISKDVQKGSAVTEPRWIKVAGNLSGGVNTTRQSISTPSRVGNNQNATISAVFSNDGDKLFYGTTDGELYRIDSLNSIDLSQLDIALPNDYTMENTTAHRRIFDFGNRSVTGIAIDPNNDDNVIVTLGNYGSVQYVQRSTNATAIGGVQFVNISGAGNNKLPNSPVYEAVIDFRDSNKVIIGTELGVFATDNAFTTNTASDNGSTVVDVQWTEENTGIGRAPVMSVKQMTFGWNEGAVNQGKVYIGTHGRGIFESGQLVGVSENVPESSPAKQGKNNLTIYPNPAVDNLDIKFEGISNGLVNVQIFNLSGQLVKEVQPTNTINGVNTMNVNVEELSQGTYIIRTIMNGFSTTGKFIKR